MTVKTIKHKFNSAVADGGDATLIRPSSWNDEHNFYLGYRAVTATSDTIVDADHLSLITYQNAGAVAASLAAPSGGLFPLGWMVTVRNIGVGTVTISGTGGATINGAGSVALAQNDSIDIRSTGGVGYVGILHPAPVTTVDKQIGGKLQYVSPTQLTFAPLNGGYIKINGVYVPIPAGGVSIANTNVYVNNVAGQNLVASTTYWLFLFNSGGNLVPSFWTIAGGLNPPHHSPSLTAGNVGTEVLDNGTQLDTFSFIGLIRTNASAQFNDDITARYVRSWYNDRTAYMQRAAGGSQGLTGSTPTELQVQLRLQFVAFKNDVVEASFRHNWYNTAAGTGVAGYGALGIDGTVAISGSECNRNFYADSQIIGDYSHGFAQIATEGEHYITPVGAQTAGGGSGVTWFASTSPPGIQSIVCKGIIHARGIGY